MAKYKVAIWRFPGDEFEHRSCVTWLMETFHKMKEDKRIDKIAMEAFSDTPITMTRNRAVKQSLANGIDYLLMVDSDVGPDYLLGMDGTARPFWAAAWEFMMARREREESHRADRESGECPPASWKEESLATEMWRLFPPATIAAPYCGKPPYENCFIFKWANHESDSKDPDFHLQMIDREDAARRSGIEEAAALPTGLILYDARVFKTLPPPWFDYEWEDVEHSEKASTEDVYQTRNASMLGMPQFVAWNCWAMHHKMKGVGKPKALKVDQVHRSLVDAVHRGHKQGERLQFVHPDNRQMCGGTGRDGEPLSAGMRGRTDR